MYRRVLPLLLTAVLLLSGCTFDIQLSEELQKQIAENTEETDEAEANLSKQAQLRDSLTMTHLNKKASEAKSAGPAGSALFS